MLGKLAILKNTALDRNALNLIVYYFSFPIHQNPDTKFQLPTLCLNLTDA